MIPPRQVQEILDATRIEDVVEEFVTLKRRGTNLIGLCPFHGERTPSFNVNPARNIFVCFGCGKKGDAITFLKEHEQMGFQESLRWLAKKYNIQIQEVERTPEQIAEMQLADSLYIVNDFGLQHFQEQLFDTDEGKSVALSYFRQRGLREDTIRAFGLGYAPDERDRLLRRAKATGHNVELLKKVGLCSQDGHRDFFRGRVMFAIHNLSGKVAAFAGRTMSSDKTVPKYINSPETEIYVKNKILYGAFQAKKSIRQHDECILVEGYMDVISLYQAGVENVVASSGTSLTEGQLQLIRRNTSNLKILYDGDAAGIKAALRGLDLALEQDLNVKICLLPDGHDPDSYVQAFGGPAMQQYMTDHARDFIFFKTDLLLDETKGDPIKRAGLVKDIVSSIAKIPDPIKRSIYLKECSSLMAIDESILISESNKLINQDLKKREQKASRQPGAASDSGPAYAPASDDWPTEPAPTGSDAYDWPDDPTQTTPPRTAPPRTDSATHHDVQERDIVRLLVQFGDQVLPNEGITVGEYLLADIEDSISSFENVRYGKMVSEAHTQASQGLPLSQAFFLHHENPEIAELAIEVISSPFEMSHNWEDRWQYPLQNQPKPELNFDADLKYSIDAFKIRKIEKMMKMNTDRIRSAFEQDNEEERIRFTLTHMKLQETLRKLKDKRGGWIIS